MEKKRRIIIAIVALVLIAALFTEFWLTRFRYDKVASPWGAASVQQPMRTNRWTGDVDFLTVHGWQRATGPSPPQQTSAEALREKFRILTESEIKQLECTAQISQGYLNVTVYNKTRLNLHGMRVRVDVALPGQTPPRISREFLVSANSPIAWLQTGTLVAHVGSELELRYLTVNGHSDQEKLNWVILEVVCANQD